MFELAPRVREIAERLIDAHHPHLQDAKELIGYYIKDDNAAWYGKCHKCTGFERFITNRTIHILILKDAFLQWSTEKLEALVDHELCHIGRLRESDEWYDSHTGQMMPPIYKPKNEATSWFIQSHNVEEFSDIIDRHGLWDEGIEKFAESVRDTDYQMTLNDFQRNNLKVVKL